MTLCCNPNLSLDSLIPIAGTLLTIIGSVFIWSKTERNKKRQEIYQRKEERYARLIQTLGGFYNVTEEGDKLIDSFLTEANLCWLYCSDNVIKKLTEFIRLMAKDEETEFKSIERKRDESKLIGELILEIRKDLIQNNELEITSLKSGDFELYNVKK